jgi:hypothetical protein
MLFPKYQKYTQATENNLKPIPENWESFVSLMKIRSGGEMKQYIPYDYQKILIRLMQQFNTIVLIKTRQLGVSQTVLSKFLHDSCINPAASNILFMRNGDDASAISRRARQMLLSIPEYAKAENDNVGYLKIKQGGDLYFKNSSNEGSRSLDSATGMLFDEAAFVNNIQQIYAASSPSSALSGDKVSKLIVSTPSAKSGWYWDKLSENNGKIDIEDLAIQVSEGKLFKELPGIYWFSDEAGTCKLIIHYLAHPGYSQIPDYLKYRLDQDGTDEETVQREYNLRFIDSSVAVFGAELIRANAIGGWEDYKENAEYYCGLDTATFGSDYVSFSVLKFDSGKYSKVHLYRKRQQTSDYHIYQISEIINKYKPKKVGIEITGGVGQIYLEQLVKLHADTQFEAIRTTGDSKPIMINNLILAMEKRVLNYPNRSPIIEEMLSFRRIGNKLEAANGKHDDVIMSTAFALIVTDFNKPERNIWSLKND